MKKCSQ